MIDSKAKITPGAYQEIMDESNVTGRHEIDNLIDD